MAPKRSPAVDRRAPGIAAARVSWEHPDLSQEYRSVLPSPDRRERSPLAPLRASAVLPVTWLSSSCSAEPSELLGIGAAVGPVVETAEGRAEPLLASV